MKRTLLTAPLAVWLALMVPHAALGAGVADAMVASLRAEGMHDDLRIGIAADEVIGTYSVNAEDLLEQAPENVPHCTGMLRHDDRLALIIDLRRMLEVFPGPSI